jgi:hypothetical protein
MTQRGGCAVLVAQAFPPLNVIGAHRALRIARVLLERHQRLYVIGLDPRELDPSQLDFDYGKDVLDNPRLVYLASKPLLDRVEFSRSKSLLQRLVGAVFCRLLCGNGLDWLPSLRRALDAIPQNEDISLVVATGSPFITFLTAVRWAARKSVPVVLDYRDLWTRNPRVSYIGIARYLVRKVIEQRVNRAAAMLTTVSQGCKAILELDASDSPVRVLLNSPDAAYVGYYGNIARDRVKKSCHDLSSRCPLRIVLTGQVYAECTFAPLLQALATLPEEALHQLEVHYYGGSSSLARREFESFGLWDRLVDHGFVSKEQSVEAILDADLLLSLIHTSSTASDPAVAGLMTTKVYDYLLSGNPILNVGPSDAEINRFAAQIGYSPFHSFRAEDTSGLHDFVRKFIVAGGLPRIAPLSVGMPSFATDLHAILDEAETIRK